ncbi:hypothetical protein GCM10027073_57340 [Streptomyces chlorus]
MPVLVDGPPPVLPHTVDLDEHFVEMPRVAGPGPAAAQSVGTGLTERGTPTTHGLVGDEDAALEHELFDLAERQREPAVPPHAVGDDLHRVPVPRVRRRRAVHGRSLSTMTNPKIIPPGQPT